MDPTCLTSFPTPLTSHLSLRDLGDLRQLYPVFLDHQSYPYYLWKVSIDKALGAVVQEIMVWARQHEADGRYRDAEYLFRRASSSNNVPVESEAPYQSEDVLPKLVSIYKKMGDYPAAEMAQETLLRRLFAAENPKPITEEQIRAVDAYSRLLYGFQKRVLDPSFDITEQPKQYIDWSIAHRVAVLDIPLLNEVSLEQGLITLEPDRSGLMLLHIAAQKNAINLAQLLIGKGAHVNDFNGNTPLHIAAKKNAINVARLLIEKGAYVNGIGLNNNTPLHMAAECANRSMIELLLANSADVDALNWRGETPLHVALTGEAALPIVAILINAKANMETEDNFGMTALKIAIRRDLPAVALLLLEHGANFLTDQEFFSKRRFSLL
ncbi:MAG: hypothetical protein Q9161_009002 [Pseudevernia consocians]